MKNTVRATLTLSSALAILFAFGRCSPIAPSISKSLLHQDKESTSLSAQSTQETRLPVILSVKLVDTEGSATLPQTDTAERIDLTNVQLDELKSSWRAEISGSPESVRTPEVFFGVNLPESQLAQTELLTVLAPSTSGKLELRIPSVDDAAQELRVQEILNNLEAVSLRVR